MGLIPKGCTVKLMAELLKIKIEVSIDGLQYAIDEAAQYGKENPSAWEALDLAEGKKRRVTEFLRRKEQNNVYL